MKTIIGKLPNVELRSIIKESAKTGYSIVASAEDIATINSEASWLKLKIPPVITFLRFISGDFKTYKVNGILIYKADKLLQNIAGNKNPNHTIHTITLN